MLYLSTYKALIVRKVLRHIGPKLLGTYSFRNKVHRNVEELKNFDKIIWKSVSGDSIVWMEK